MAKHFVAVYAESGCFLIACGHKHQNITTAAACVSEAGGYVVAVRRHKFLPLNDAEDAEFQRVMYGRQLEKKKKPSPNGSPVPATLSPRGV
jgi:hypothetical protein